MSNHSRMLQDLLNRAMSGDEAALGELLDAHRAYLKVLSRRCIEQLRPGPVDASDIVHEAYLSAVRAFPSFRGHSLGEFIAWLKAIHLHAAGDVVRRTRAAKRGDGRVQPMEEEPIDLPKTPSQRMMDEERAVELAAALEKLPESQREALRLRFFEDCSLSEVARRMERSERACAGLIFRGTAALKEIMRE